MKKKKKIKALKKELEREQELRRKLEENLENLEKIEKIKPLSEQEIRRKYCKHEWGAVTWYHACGGTRTCLNCGETEIYYERD